MISCPKLSVPFNSFFTDTYTCWWRCWGHSWSFNSFFTDTKVITGVPKEVFDYLFQFILHWYRFLFPRRASSRTPLSIHSSLIRRRAYVAVVRELYAFNSFFTDTIMSLKMRAVQPELTFNSFFTDTAHACQAGDKQAYLSIHSSLIRIMGLTSSGAPPLCFQFILHWY